MRWTPFSTILLVYAAILTGVWAGFILAGHTGYSVLTGFALAIVVGALIGSIREPFPVSGDDDDTR